MNLVYNNAQKNREGIMINKFRLLIIGLIILLAILIFLMFFYYGEVKSIFDNILGITT